MWQYSLIVLCATVAALGAHTLPIDDQGLALSGQGRHVQYYHYPMPRRTLQLPTNANSNSNAIVRLDQQLLQQPEPQPLQQQQQYQQQYHRQEQHYGASSSLPSSLLYRAAIAEQFASPTLERAAFAMALTSQGYAYRVALTALAATRRASSTQSSQSSQSALSVIVPAAAASGADAYSLNVKLPLPLGSMPIKIAPLPLQSGAPYASLPRLLTSYGTPQPQRRRR